jgi:serine/threonine-protein kinase RsbW
MEKAKTIQLTLESELVNVPVVGSAVRRFCSETPLNDTSIYQIELSVVEAITNIIKHAYFLMPGYKIYVELSLCSDRVRFRITDTGKSIPPAVFDHFNGRSSNPTPTGRIRGLLTAEAGSLAESGRGFEIIGSCMDEVTYTSSGGSNILTITRYFNSPRTCGQALPA